MFGDTISIAPIPRISSLYWQEERLGISWKERHSTASRIDLSWTVTASMHNATCDWCLGICRRDDHNDEINCAARVFLDQRDLPEKSFLRRDFSNHPRCRQPQPPGLTLNGYETTRSLLATGGERRGGCCGRDARSTTTAEEEEVSQRDRVRERRRKSVWTDRHWQSVGTLGAYFKTTVLPTRKRRRPFCSDTIQCNLLWPRCWWTYRNRINLFFFLSFSFSLWWCANLREQLVSDSNRVDAAFGIETMYRWNTGILNSSVGILYLNNYNNKHIQQDKHFIYFEYHQH